MYKVYVKTDGSGRIVAINSDAFLSDIAGWTLISEGETDQHHHAQGNYFPQPIMTDEGVYRYALVDGQVQERSAEDIAASLAFSKDEVGYWPADQQYYQAKANGTVWTPSAHAAAWTIYEINEEEA